MHQRDDRRPGSGRPSLLTPDEKAEVNRDSILGQLDSKAGRAAASTSPGRRSRWIAGAAVIAALGAGAIGLAVYDDSEPVKPIAATSPAPASQPSSPPATPAAAQVVAADDVLAPAQAQESNAAAIVDAPIEPGKERSLDDILTAPPRPKSSPDELVQLLDKPSAAHAKASAKREAEPAPKKEKKAKSEPARKEKAGKEKSSKDKDKDRDRDRRDKTRAQGAESKSKPAKAAPVDNDVALLAALVAHTKSSSASHQSKIALQYKQCAAQPSVAKADRCRAHICANSGKNDPVCKPKRPSKASGES